ncbi:hypothetical protein LSH36_831g00018 [Paralvinella palmiformis]|uniref:THAP-type domain-containing protein n=1 Tax=Paralvinella palmiformis TaxID=53620 RepID=A0AAD9MTS3_9ANNE|nr:hypothetical protein LSH36_831g00018 [Paralvinella palmiformis]
MGISFFSFPKQDQRCAAWIQNVRRADLLGRNSSDMKYFKFRAIHFENTQFKNLNERNSLNLKAVPTLINI